MSREEGVDDDHVSWLTSFVEQTDENGWFFLCNAEVIEWLLE